MCSMEKDSMISCQISYFPIDSKDYLEETDQVLKLIENSGLEYNIDILSTTIKGKSEVVFNLIERIHQEMSAKTYNYTMNIMISNVCGFINVDSQD